jgi:hypothetical protein
MSKLESLSLATTSITGAGLEHLEGLSNLIDLNVLQTLVSDDDADDLLAQLRSARVATPRRPSDIGGDPATDAKP